MQFNKSQELIGLSSFVKWTLNIVGQSLTSIFSDSIIDIIPLKINDFNPNLENCTQSMKYLSFSQYHTIFLLLRS